MRFYIPTDVYVEKNCVKNHEKAILACGKKALIVTGKHSAKNNGSLDEVLEILKNGNVPYGIFDEVEENPSVETVARAAQMGKAFAADFIIGIGGGSPIDAAKAIALLIANPKETEEILYTPKKLDALSLVAIPTTCGTGTEATPASVLTNRKGGFKKSIAHKIFPKLSLVDGKYLAFASKELIVNTAVDALAHLVESYLNSQSNVYNRMFPEYGLKCWEQNKEALLSNSPINENLYENLMLASTLAGMSIAHTSTAVPHGMSYDLTYNFNVPHGKAVGYFLAAYMEVCEKAVPKDVRTILDLLKLKDVVAFAEMVKALIGTYELPRATVEKFATRMCGNSSKLKLSPCELSKENVWEIYEKSLILL
ncbi:MAG: iron-containing alcohol dehydrogenase family protein [Fibrobacter sp.]|nr:iron-containing alcohol dehydrogenase family protein [Fibrobacter sp.]MDY6368517.1 iron-containing alcohol dehydrogenase family protein [Fibrobacter sp.]MDY6391204.1 iron-containing alcohol dehydrogenase family protein [Fibrobacter sp.]